MSGDLRTVMWKEWHAFMGGRARRQLALTAGILAMWAVVFPIQMGARWVTDNVPMGAMAIVLPMVAAGIIVPEAIAGERERHTLTTLLASRLPDRAILFGKLAFGILLSWIMAPLLLAIALVVVNVAVGGPTLLMYDPISIAIVLGLGLLVAIMTGGVAVFFSLRANSAQEAQQMTLVLLMLPLTVLGVAMTAVFSSTQLVRDLFAWLAGADLAMIFTAIAVALALIDAALLWAADRRFRRARLIAG